MANANKYIINRTAIKNNNMDLQPIIKSHHIKLQNSSTATGNLMEFIEKEGRDVGFIQEPSTVHNRVAGITKSCGNFTLSP
jgi:hypothetical protein